MDAKSVSSSTPANASKTASQTSPATKTFGGRTSATATITSDPGILCFHHCNVKVFCFKLPHICPNCKVELDNMKEEGANSTILATSKTLLTTAAAAATTSTLNSNSLSDKSKSKSKANYSSSTSSSLLMTKSSSHPNDKRNGSASAPASASASALASCTSSSASNAFPKNRVSNLNSYNNDDEDENQNDDDNADDSIQDQDELHSQKLKTKGPVAGPGQGAVTGRAAEHPQNNTKANDNGISLTKKLLPFRLPYPFVRASQYPCAIVLRPTSGDFLNDYNNSKDLHIAVTTSTGCIVEFDRHGLRRHRGSNMSEWEQCLLVGDVPEAWYDYWDDILFEICNQKNRWSVAAYQEDAHNCYTFVLTFLQALSYDKLSSAAQSKTRFCEKYIVPRTTTAGKYISLYRKLRDTGIYVHHQTNHNNTKVRTLTIAHGNTSFNNHRAKNTRNLLSSSSQSSTSSSSSSSLSGSSLAALYSSLTLVSGAAALPGSSVPSAFPALPGLSSAASQSQPSMSQNIMAPRSYSSLCTIEE